MDPEGSYVSITRLPDAKFQLTCQAGGGEFDCAVNVENLSVLNYRKTLVTVFIN